MPADAILSVGAWVRDARTRTARAHKTYVIASQIALLLLSHRRVYVQSFGPGLAPSPGIQAKID